MRKGGRKERRKGERERERNNRLYNQVLNLQWCIDLLTMSAASKSVSEEGDEGALEDRTQKTVGIVRQIALLGDTWVTTSWVQLL